MHVVANSALESTFSSLQDYYYDPDSGRYVYDRNEIGIDDLSEDSERAAVQFRDNAYTATGSSFLCVRNYHLVFFSCNLYRCCDWCGFVGDHFSNGDHFYSNLGYCSVHKAQ